MQTSPQLDQAILRLPVPRPKAEAHRHLDSLTKPLGSLGRLEDLAAQLHALGIETLNKAAFVFAADHGLAVEGVSLYPQEVTRQMVLNFLAGGAAINVLARQQNAAIHIIDCGVAGPLPDHPKLTKGAIRAGSRNSRHEPAMSYEELEAAFALGLDCARQAVPYNLVAVGEMGIGNTSAATLLTAALTGQPIESLTGPGTGLPSLTHKIAVLSEVLARHLPALTSPYEILRNLGGLEIATMTAFILGAAANGSAILVDGFISTAAAAFSLAFCPQVRPFLIPAHQSEEPGHRLLLAHLELVPLLHLHMRLGEGSGAVLAMPLVESALNLYQQMATFTSAQVSEAPASPAETPA